ncbi:MAG: FAD-binding oxidoreductase [Candidatus Bathyarchaeota archaeon]|nr:FAD-binding oxidoreductase [Candidatus Bathyarchaeota archaeon]
MAHPRIDEDIRRRLEAIVGAENVSFSKDDIEKASVDESPLEPHPPEVVVKPGATTEVSAVMKLANEKLIPVVAQGSRTGLAGASHPIRGGIALSLERMNKILEIDEENLMAVVEPAALVDDVHKAVEKVGLYYPPDPGQESGSIGGNINTNAGGMRALKYGTTRDYVQALEVVLPSGEVINVGGKVVKDTTGYSLLDLLIGSEGTLGIVTKATLRLVPKPKHTALIYAPFESTHDAAKAVSEIIRRKVQPFALELMSRHAVETVERYLERKLPDDTHPAYLIVGVESNSETELGTQLETAGEVCIENGAVDAYIADTAEKQRQMWESRKAVYDAYNTFYEVDEADICVPRSRIPDFIDRLDEIGAKHKVQIIPVGHAGDGNIHCNIIRLGGTDEEWHEQLEATISDLIDLGLGMGGTVSGEHGLGYTKRLYLVRKVGATQVELMKEIKRVFDPNGILNPDKIWG